MTVRPNRILVVIIWGTGLFATLFHGNTCFMLWMIDENGEVS